MKHNKLLTLSLLASLLILTWASYASAANTLIYQTKDVCPRPTGATIPLTVSIANDVDLAAIDIIGKTVSIAGGVQVKVTGLTFDNRMLSSSILDQRYPLDVVVDDFRFGAVKLDGVNLGFGTGQVATLTVEFISNCKLGTAEIQPGLWPCPVDPATGFVDANANPIDPVIINGAINVVDAAPFFTNCPPPGPINVYWNGGSYMYQFAADDPDLGCGCDAITYEMLDGVGAITAAGKYTYTGDADDIGCQVVRVLVKDKPAYGKSDTCEFTINVLNVAPIISGISIVSDTALCGDTLFAVWDLTLNMQVLADDPDDGPADLNYSLLPWGGLGAGPTIGATTGIVTWNVPIDPAYWGTHTIGVIVDDQAPLDQCNKLNADTCLYYVHISGNMVSVEKVHHALQGHQTEVSIYLDSMLMGSTTMYDDTYIGGYDILLAYDASALTFIGAAPGALLTEFGWEYFTYRFGPNGNCGNGCPSGMLRLVALAETNNGGHHPDLTTHAGELAKLTFFVSTDRNLECQYAPISFYWFDCGDNALADVTGRFLFVGDSVYFFEGGAVPNLEDTLLYGFDGAEPFCWDTLQIGHPPSVKDRPLRGLVFRNGGIDIECADTIDARGDINLNGIMNEIADAVMYTNYFIMGEKAFGNPITEPMRIEAAKAASDVNADGLRLSVADLVYLVRIITGDAQPYAKPASGADLIVSSQLMSNNMTISYNSSIDLGAVLLRFNVNGSYGTATLGNGAAGMDVISGVLGSELRVLVYSISENAIASGNNVLLTIPVDGSLELVGIEAADYFGNPMTTSVRQLPSRYDVSQNYPNPFNPTTTIDLALPVAGDYSVAIYNIAGQIVRTFTGSAQAGIVSIVWDGKDASGSQIASGLYFYKATASNFSATKKMILMK